MYIHSITINGFRNFTSTEVLFREGVNVIIGHNNAGKSNLLKALSLVLDANTSKRLEVDDFNQHVLLSDLQSSPPSVKIQVVIKQSEGEAADSDDLATVANWLTELKEPYEAKLTYEFFLPDNIVPKYLDAIASSGSIKEILNTIRHDFIRNYVSRIYCGDESLKIIADYEALNKFDYQFLNAIRDVERDMFSGRNTLLREVLDFFIDYEIKNDSTKGKVAKLADIKSKKDEFSNKTKQLLGELQLRMAAGQLEILQYAQETGASFQNAEPAFDGVISEAELYSALRLIIKYTTGIEVPATHNGLGYNNLIFMSLLLAKMQVDTNGEYLGSNAKVFPILVIEEPEAHLHPAMQYKFLKFLRSNSKNKARQIFITSHSTHITSAVSLDELICLSYTQDTLSVGYPGRAFTDSKDDRDSKAYVQRFLDATKSDMLFAKGVIMVEGIAEQILMATLAKYCEGEKLLEDNHIAVVNIGGRYFNHFLKIFDTVSPHAINKKIACITDCDPSRKEKTLKSSYTSCYPYEFDVDSTKFDYLQHGPKLVADYASHSNIRYFSQDPAAMGKTLEYDLMLFNLDCEMLITESLANKPEIESLVQFKKDAKSLAEIEATNMLRDTDENDRILNSLKTAVTLSDPQKVDNLIASRYLNSVKKGEHALELAQTLEENIQSTAIKPFIVPTYLSDAITWVC